MRRVDAGNKDDNLSDENCANLKLSSAALTVYVCGRLAFLACRTLVVARATMRQHEIAAAADSHAAVASAHSLPAAVHELVAHRRSALEGLQDCGSMAHFFTFVATNLWTQIATLRAFDRLAVRGERRRRICAANVATRAFCVDVIR